MGWEFFSDDELRCKCGCGLGASEMDPRFMTKIVTLRRRIAKPFVVTSAYRCANHNERVSRTRSRTGAHTTGRAMDFLCDGEMAWEIIRLASDYGFRGIGLQLKGGSKYMHLDDCDRTDTMIRPLVWSY